MRQVISLERVYPYSIEQVWYALTNQSALASWLMKNDFEPRLGHQFQFQTRSDLELAASVYCEVIALEAPTQLSYTWREQWMDQPSIVTWTLKAVEVGTHLCLCHSSLDTAVSSREFMSPVHLWRGQAQQTPPTQVQARTVLATFTFDFEREWVDRLAQLAEYRPD